MTETKPDMLDRFYEYAYPRPWAWAILRFVAIPAWAAVDIVRRHIPEYITELRGLWAKLEAERKADRAK